MEQTNQNQSETDSFLILDFGNPRERWIKLDQNEIIKKAACLSCLDIPFKISIESVVSK